MNKIVFVEDDPEVGALIAAYLGKHDMDVIVEPRGDRAEEVIAREKPDLILLDIMLPGKDGMTLCRDLRQQWSGPIVLLTSLDSDMNHILSLEMGANDYILKTTPLRFYWRVCDCIYASRPAPHSKNLPVIAKAA
jgi:two-component system response regulator RstA